MYTILVSSPQILHPLFLYLVVKLGSGMPVVIKLFLYMMVPILLSLHVVPSLLCAMGQLSQSKTLIQERL